VGNYFVAMFKDTALVSTISVADLMFQGEQLGQQSFQYFQVYTVIFVIYFIISFPASMLMRWLERRLKVGVA
jgi:polar amino acid transport system permease protein